MNTVSLPIEHLQQVCPLRVLIAMNNPLLRLGLPSTLGEHGMQVVGESVEQEQILSLAQNARPDVVLFDGALAWPSCTGVEMVNQIRQRVRAIFVIVATPNEEHFFQFFRAGAVAYELDTIESSDLTRKIRQVAEGSCLLTEEVLQPPVKSYQEPVQEEDQASKAEDLPTLPVEQLCQIFGITVREIEVLCYMRQGYSNKEIGRLLRVSEQTIKNHITHINRRLHTGDRTEAVVVALCLGLIVLPDEQGVQQSGQTLTRREIEILRYVMRGYSNKQTGRELHRSDQTVKNHITCAIRKLAARNRTEAVVLALGAGLLHLSEARPVRLLAVKTVLRVLGEKPGAGIPPSGALAAMGRGAT